MQSPMQKSEKKNFTAKSLEAKILTKTLMPRTNYADKFKRQKFDARQSSNKTSDKKKYKVKN